MSFYTETIKLLDAKLRVDESFDIIKRTVMTGAKTEATFYFVDGFTKDTVTQKLMEYFVSAESTDICMKSVPYMEVEACTDIETMVTAVLSGQTAALTDTVSYSLIIDTRTYPTRSIDEPENDKVLRGPRDGLTETLIFNTALIRRRIRSPELTMKYLCAGSESKTDIVLCYMNDRADKKYIERLENQINGLKRKALSMGQESLSEALIGRGWWNPFPRIRYTERPDAVAAAVLEGTVAVIIDNTPAVMLLPSSIFDFLQESDDFYFPPVVGTYMRLTRMFVFLLALLLTPVWYLLTKNPQWLPEWFEFILVSEPAKIPLLLQLLLAELAIDGLKLASMNTPSMLGSSLSVVGGLILGEFAVNAGWFCSETILYMAVVAIANFSQQSYELGYAFKFMRMLTIILTGIFNLWGFIAGLVITLLFIVLTKTVNGSRSYLYPLIPFNAKALGRMFIRPRRVR